MQIFCLPILGPAAEKNEGEGGKATTIKQKTPALSFELEENLFLGF